MAKFFQHLLGIILIVSFAFCVLTLCIIMGAGALLFVSRIIECMMGGAFFG